MLKYENIIIIRKKILTWWSKNKRDFYWRNTDNPYEILCAEIMLQRTQAKVVNPVLERFLNHYPNIYELNKAEIDTIREIIKPLGLIKRADLIKEISSIIIDEHNGCVPSDKNELLSIPGIGDYTACAILSFAFEDNYGVLDTNTTRFLKRVFDIDEDEYRKGISLFIKDSCSKDINYALLDFAALICRKISPNCSSCPITSSCNYYK